MNQSNAEVNQEIAGLPGFVEFVGLMALTMSLVALATDAILPAFPMITRELQLTHPNDVQLTISVMFAGLAVAQLLYGPLADSIGRKPAMYVGFAIFVGGCLMSALADNFTQMLLGRLLQGLGAAGPRVVALALIRDRYHGSRMARVTSFIMTVFILVPIFAPLIGQGVLLVSSWHWIFGLFAMVAFTAWVWLGIRQPETWPPERRLPFTLRKAVSTFGIVLQHRRTMACTVITGGMFGALFGYINSSQQIFQELYQLGTKFPLYFGILACWMGLASLVNSTLVMRFGMHALAHKAIWLMTTTSWVLFGITAFAGGHPPLWLFMVMCAILFFSFGLLFGNLNAIAMEPLGHIAGTASSVIGSISTLLASVLGTIIGQLYNDSLWPLAAGFFCMSTLSFWLARLVHVEADQPD